ncbi:MAG: class I SAM-dependent methyltransferase [Acidimicrobiales bacterium]|jgi:methyltransferase (TIGR00027 family)
MRDGRASLTAQRVAAQRLTFDRLEAPFGDPDSDERLASDVASEVGPVGIGPMTRYLSARTRFFDRVVVTALDGGTTQVVVAGAGYDGRSLRYAKPGVAWFEVDHPDTQADKRRRLDRLGIATPGTTFVAADFTEGGLPVALRDAGHDPAVPTLFLCEGVAVYLEPAVLASLVESLRRVAAPGSRLAISLSVTDGGEELATRRRIFDEAVAALGEPTRSVLTAGDAEALFHATGWRSVPSAVDPHTVASTRRAGFVTAEPA